LDNGFKFIYTSSQYFNFLQVFVFWALLEQRHSKYVMMMMMMMMMMMLRTKTAETIQSPDLA